MAGDLELDIGHANTPVQVPAEIAGARILAVAAAEQPEAGAVLVLDLEIIAHRRRASPARFHHSP